MKNLIGTMIRGLSLIAVAAVVGGILIVGNAQAQIQIGNAVYGGTGCPKGSASVSEYVGGNGEISIIFDKFLVQSGARTGRQMDRKACSVVISFMGAPGYSVALVGIGNGSYQAGRRAQVRLDQDLFFAGSTGKRITQIFKGPASNGFETSPILDAGSLAWSPCGASVNLRANLSLLTQGESFGVWENLNLKVLFKRCH